jgi:hypothetical protein
MKIAALIARILLGLIFFVFGLNGYLHFIPMGQLPPGLAGQFVSVFMQSHYVYLVAAFQVIGGALLLINRYVPLALTFLGPVIVNILAFHILMAHTGIGMAFLVAILWFIVFIYHRQYFAGLFVQKAS